MGQPKLEKFGPKFNDIICDELSEFEETRALREIFKHQDEEDFKRLK